MCDAGLIAGAVLSAGSVAANSAAQSKVDSARNDALNAERIRQGGLQSRADALNAQSQQSYDGFGDKQADRAKSLSTMFTEGNGQTAAPQGAAQPTESAPASTSNIVTQETAKQNAKAKGFTDQQGNALGELRSFGDYLGTLGRDQARNAGYINQTGNFMQGSSAVLPYELDAAGHAGDGLKGIGDIARLGGSLATSYGLTRNVAGAAGAANTAASSLPSFAQSAVSSAIPQIATPFTVGRSAVPGLPSMFGAAPPKVY